MSDNRGIAPWTTVGNRDPAETYGEVRLRDTTYGSTPPEPTIVKGPRSPDRYVFSRQTTLAPST
jgi:hypothetical protein